MASSSRAPVNTTPSPTAIRRLSRDLQKLKDEPIDGIDAQPLEENILEWHYVIKGTKGTPFEGGLYHGKLVFPCEFPWKPPSIYMFTPNGRFLPNQRLCLSISDYHPETWNPGWTVSAILVGLHSFMNETSIATGTETTTPERKKELAVKSASYNLRDANFCKLFPTLVTEIQSKGVEKMTDAQAQEETSRTAPRYGRAGLMNGGDAAFMHNARQQMMMQIQNEANLVDQAMRAVMRDPLPMPMPMRNPILPDDMYFGVGAGADRIMRNHPQPRVPPPMQLPGVMGAVAGGGAGMEMGAPAALPPLRYDLMDNLVDDFMPVQERAGPAVAVVQGIQQEAGPAGVAGPLRRAAADDGAALDPPPPKRTPEVVTLD